MIIHHMSDGTIRHSIEGVVIPPTLKNVYILAKKNGVIKKENGNGNSNTSRDFRKEQVLDR